MASPSEKEVGDLAIFERRKMAAYNLHHQNLINKALDACWSKCASTKGLPADQHYAQGYDRADCIRVCSTSFRMLQFGFVDNNLKKLIRIPAPQEDVNHAVDAYSGPHEIGHAFVKKLTFVQHTDRFVQSATEKFDSMKDILSSFTYRVFGFTLENPSYSLAEWYRSRLEKKRT